MTVSVHAQTPPFAVGEMTIAPTAQALTFARGRTSDGTRLLAVLAYNNAGVQGVDLSAWGSDPITVYQQHGYSAIADFVEDQRDRQITVYAPHESLLIPVDLSDRHIAAGTNFVAHAEEATVEDGPFLFVKAVTPTSASDPVQVMGRLLDYEVELAFVTMQDTDLSVPPARLGLILCNDFTDRGTLLRHANIDNIVSGDGFTQGKSAPGFLPVGNLFVIPNVVSEFYPQINLHLAVNGQPRQAAPLSWVVWDLPALFRETLARAEQKWVYGDDVIALPIDDGKLPARTLLMAGTPAGTVFQGVPLKDMILGGMDWLFGGWDQSVIDHVIEQYIESALASGDYLQPGDLVHIRVDQLGEIRTLIQ